MEYLVKRRLYRGAGQYTEVGETVVMEDRDAEPLLNSGSLEKKPEPKRKKKDD